MKQTLRYAAIILSAAVLTGLSAVTPAVGSLSGDTSAAASLKPPRRDPPSRGGGGNQGAQQQQRASQERAAQQRAAQERAVQQRAAQERAAQQRAAQERAAQQRVAQERAAQQRAAQDQERASEQRAAQQRAAEEAARRPVEADARHREDSRSRETEQNRSREDALRRQPEQESLAQRLAQQRAAEAARSRNQGDSREDIDRSSADRLRGFDNDSRQESAREEAGRPQRSADRSATLDDMRKRLEAIRRNDESRAAGQGDRLNRGIDDSARDSDRPDTDHRGGEPAEIKRDARPEAPEKLLEGPDILRDRDGERENVEARDNSRGESNSSNRGRDDDDRDDDGPRFRATPLAPGALQNSGRGNANDDARRAMADLDRSGSGPGSGPGPGINLPRSSSRGEVDGRDPRVFSHLDRNQRAADLTRHSDHLIRRDSHGGPPSRLPLRHDVGRDDFDLHRHVDRSVHFHNTVHKKVVVVNPWVHHPRFAPRFRSHCDSDFAFLRFSTGSFSFGFGVGDSCWRPYRYCSPFTSYRVVYSRYHWAPVRYHSSSYWYDDYCDWYYGPWYRPYVKVVHHYDSAPAYRSYDSGYAYSSGSVLTSGGYDEYDNSGTSIFGDEVVDEAPATIDEAWQLLVDGFLTEARELFVEIGTQYPFEGEPQIGYAIAAGLLHDDEAAAFAMRKAMTDQPESIVLVPQNLAMQGHLTRLLDRWEELSRAEPSADAMFMIAALRFMLQDEATAYFAVDEAIAAGDDDPSTVNLKDVIRASMYETMYDE